MSKFDGMSVDMSNLHLLSDARTRSISAENFTGEKGKAGMATEGTGASCARDLGRGWKISPSIHVQPKSTFTLADIKGPGAIQHIWITPNGTWRYYVLRFYWDDQEQPSVECPLGDFFAAGLQTYRQISSLPVCVNPKQAFNCYWTMPFRKRCRITIENLAEEVGTIYYQIDYALTDVPADAAYFHAQFRRTNPLPYKQDYTLIDGVRGKGHYVGTFMLWGQNNNGWWGEGEIKFFLDGDGEYPTICGTGTEDYFCGSYNFDIGKENGGYTEFTTPYGGIYLQNPDGLYVSQQRFGLYRWHITDPIRFEKDLRVTIQALGWRSGGRYLPRQDDISSVVFWYQTLPTAPFPPLPSRDGLEII